MLVNNDPVAARTAGAHGVHLPEHSITVEVCRQALVEPGLVGCSVHSVQRAREAALEGADYVIFSPIFRPSTKPDLPGVGLDALRLVAEASAVPVFALGGISPRQVASCIEAGAYGVAVLAGLMAPELEGAKAARAYLNALSAATSSS